MSDPATAETENPLGPLGKQLIDAAMRHALTVAAGVLVTRGAMQPDQTSQFVSITAGLLVGVAGYGWSILQKRFARRVVQAASASLPTAVAP